MRTRENCGGLDGFRLAAALFVIAIHTSPLTTFSANADFFLTRILARTAVPFFLMVTGQFVVGRFLEDPDSTNDSDNAPNREHFAVLWRYLRKIMLLYLVSIILYLPIGIYAGHYKSLTFGAALRMLFFDGTFYHLWYFPACIIGVLLVYLMSRALKLPGMLAVSSFLYLLGLLGDSYFGLVKMLPPLESVYEFCFHISSYTRNGLFLAPLFLVLGAWVGKGGFMQKDTEDSKRYIALNLTGLSVSFLLMTGEAFYLRHLEFPRHDSMYLLLVPVMIFLYQSLLCLHAAPQKRLRNAALWIYVLHPAFIVVVRGIAKPLKMTSLLVDNSLIHYLAVTALSLGAGFCMVLLQDRISRRRALAALPNELKVFEEIENSEQARIAAQNEDARLSEIPKDAGDIRQAWAAVKDDDTKQDPVKEEPKEIDHALNIGTAEDTLQAHAAGRAWIQIDRAALSRNVAFLRTLMPGNCRLMPAVKANAYGHGAVLIARELNRLGVDSFCVACAAEGISLRRADIKGEILILGYTAPEDFPLLVRYRLTQTVIDYTYAELLARSGLDLHVHVGIDTGMHRLGIRCENIEEIIRVFEMKNLIIDGMLTHFSVSDYKDTEGMAFTKAQTDAFYQVIEILEAQGFSCPKLHVQSSYGLLNYPSLHADYVRAGIILYGVHSSIEHAVVFKGTLSPVLSLMARVISIRTLYPGDSAGYGMAFTAEKDMKLAVLSIGYADGLPRELSGGRGYVLIHGRKAPVIGRVCMDLTLVDVSEIPQTQTGDIAVIIGRSGELEIAAEEIAAQCGTITNELLSRLGSRLERFVI